MHKPMMQLSASVYMLRSEIAQSQLVKGSLDHSPFVCNEVCSTDTSNVACQQQSVLVTQQEKTRWQNERASRIPCETLVSEAWWPPPYVTPNAKRGQHSESEYLPRSAPQGCQRAALQSPRTNFSFVVTTYSLLETFHVCVQTWKV